VPLLSILQVSHFGHKCCKCQKKNSSILSIRSYNDIGGTLETPQTTDLEEEEWVNKVYKLFATGKSTQKTFLERSAPLYTDRERWRSVHLFRGAL
jgi:hypothetical protein